MNIARCFATLAGFGVRVSVERALFAIVVIAVLGPCDASAAWHDRYPDDGPQLPVHYVHLTGHGGDNDANRANLLARQHACVDMMKVLGKSVKSMSADELPAVISVHDIEIYYAAQRTLTVSQGTLFDINRDDCTVLPVPHHIVHFAWTAGRCDVDLIRKLARGSCDVASLAGGPLPGAAVQPRRPARALDVPGRVVAGVSCQDHRLPLGDEVCVAEPDAKDAPNPYPIPPAPLNAGVPGILVEARTRALTLRAREVRLNISVSNQMFALPPGIRVKAGATE